MFNRIKLSKGLTIGPMCFWILIK